MKKIGLRFEGIRSKSGKDFEQSARYLDPKHRELLAEWLEEARTRQHSSFTTRFTHGDFWHKHVYFDPDTGGLTGIIDWGDTCIQDPAFDFFGLWAYGERFIDSVLSHYIYDDATLKDRSCDYYRMKTVVCMCHGERRFQQYGKQLLSGHTENRSGDFR